MDNIFNNFFDRPYRTIPYPLKNFGKAAEIENDDYSMLVRNFLTKVSDELIQLVIKKGIEEEEAMDFTKYMLFGSEKRKLDVKDIVEKCYKDGNSKKECAQILLDKYYKIARINVYKDKENHEEVTEVGVTESVKDYLKPKSEDEILNNFKDLDPSDILYKSMIKGYLPGVKLAIEKFKKLGVYIEKYDILEFGVNENRLEIVKYLISIGVNIPKDMSNILQTAFENNNTELMNYLIKIYVKKYKDINILLDYINKNENDYYELFDYLKNVYKTNESVQTEVQRPTVSMSMLWNFLNRIKDLEQKFILNTRYINNIPNSLNTPNYMFYVETKPVNNKDVEFEFKHSRMLSSIVTTFDRYKESTSDISFYLGIDNTNMLNIGYIIGEKRIKIGSLRYKSNDILKISTLIESTDKEVDTNILFQRFLSTLSLIQYYKRIFVEYLEAYEEDIEIYTSIIDNRFVVVIESIDSDIINKKYLEGIVNNNKFIKRPFQYEWEINTTTINKKIYFYFTIKK